MKHAMLEHCNPHDHSRGLSDGYKLGTISSFSRIMKADGSPGALITHECLPRANNFLPLRKQFEFPKETQPFLHVQSFNR